MAEHPGEDDRPVPDWIVEQLAAGGLPPDDANRVRARLAARGELGRLDAIAAGNASFVAAHPVGPAAAEIRRRAGAIRAEPAPRRLRLVRVAAPLVAAAAVLALWLVRPSPSETTRLEDPELVRLKGHRAHLVIYRKSTAGSERLADRERVRAGDTLQLAYVSAGQRFGVIASIDARGSVTLHLPEEPGAARALAPERETAMPHSYVLDDTPGFERFVLVTADREFSTELVTAALRSQSTAWPADLSTSDFTLEKESP